MKTPLVIAITGILMAGCTKPQEPAKPPLSMEEMRALISGHYEGWYAKGKEYFVLRSDGTFSQMFVQRGATNYVAEGKWTVEQYRSWYEVRFNPFMDLSETIGRQKSPERIGGRVATFFEDRIDFVPDLAYFIVRKRSVAGGTNKVEK